MKTKINSLCRAACASALILGAATLTQTARSAPALVGEWLTNSTLADLSGFSPMGTHDGYDVANTGSYVFTNDVPPGKHGMSLLLWNGDTGIGISNSATTDGATYVNTFDDQLQNSFTVCCWSKGFPAGWAPFVSKWGEGAPYNTPTGGWQLRAEGNDIDACFTVRDTNSGALVFGNGGDALDDLTTTTMPSNDGGWHFYAGVFSATTGIRSLYVDSVLAAQETGNIPYGLEPDVHVCIGAKETPPGGTFGNFGTMEIYDVRIYNYDLTSNQVSALYGVVPATVTGQPQSVSSFTNQSVSFFATIGGTPPMKYQWLLNNVPVQSLTDAANFTGINSNTLTVLNVSPADAGAYQLIVSNVILGVTYTAISSNAVLTVVPKTLVGEWFTNGTFTDLSQFSPAGTHDGYPVGGQNYYFTNDVPNLWYGQSIAMLTGDSAVAITNSSTADGTYTNTYDQSAFTVAFWAKGNQLSSSGSQWSQYVTKDGYNNNISEQDGLGWSIGDEGWSHHLYFDMEGIDHGGITYTLGDGLWGNGILETFPQAIPPDATSWHHYAATYSAATGIRAVYYDGVLVAQQNNLGSYHSAATQHLVIGGQEQKTAGLDAFNNAVYYDVRMYNYDLSANKVLYLLAPSTAPPVITAQPASTYGNAGNTTKFTVGINGGRPLTYQWQVSTDNGTNYSNVNDPNVTGATNGDVAITTLAFNNLQVSETGLYRLHISNANGVTNSTPVQLTVVPSSPLVYTWQAPVSINDLTAEQILDAIPGTFVEAGGAFPWWHTVTTANGNVYPFQGTAFGTPAVSVAGQSGDVWWTGPFNGHTTGNSDLDGVLAAEYSDGGAHQITMHNLTPGVKYSVQLIGLDDNSGNTTRQSNYQDLNNSADVSATFAMGDNVYVIGTFTAIYSDMTVQQNLLTSGNGNINAVIVRDLTPKFSGGAPVISTSPDGLPQLVLHYYGTLLSSTNVAGPYSPVAGATSPYTNYISAAPQMFFKIQ